MGQSLRLRSEELSRSLQNSRPGRENSSADALLRMPYLPAPPEGIAEGQVQVSVVRSHATIPELLAEGSTGITHHMDDFWQEQMKDPSLKDLLLYLADGVLPNDERAAQKK